MDNKTDFEYFKDIWESFDSGWKSNSADVWNTRASDWESLLGDDTAFKRSHSERIAKVAEYLRGRGLLGNDSSVVDIGCGPGRFVAEFAKTAGHVLGIDLSDKMVENGEKHARDMGLPNTSWHACDFKNVDIDDMGWRGKFDLVFTSITHAVNNIDSLRKAMSISRAHCFNSSFVNYVDDLESRVSEEVFSRGYKSKPMWNGRWFYALFNILWLEGYYPETNYYKRTADENVPVDDELVRYLTRTFSKEKNENDMAIKPKISEYLYSISDKDGMIMRHSERLYGWVLWDVREKRGIR